MSKNGIVGVILAGGQGRRMGYRDKFALELAAERLVDRAARRLGPQVETVVVASHRDVGGGLVWCADIFKGSMGPLAGLHAGFTWATANFPQFRALASVPVDCPFFPLDLVARLNAAGPPAFVRDPTRPLPIFGLWPRELAGPLSARLADGSELRVDAFAEAVGAKEVEFTDPNAFFNVNREEDLEAAARLLGPTS
jgi:molybdopterin-guanine dinucleotide biosynthesis protein A